MSVPQWNADIITPEDEGSGTKVLDGNQVVQPTLEGGTNITISDGTISATGGGAEYYAGEGININSENAISITQTVRDGAALGATSVQPADLNSYVLASSLATVATSGDYDDLLDKPSIPTVDQTYDGTSTNAQSGTAVAQAIAGIPAPSDEVSVVSYGTPNTEVTFLKRPNVKLTLSNSSVQQTSLTTLAFDEAVPTTIINNTVFLLFSLDGKPPYLTGSNGGQLIISEDLAFPVQGQGAWGSSMYVFAEDPANLGYTGQSIYITTNPIVGGVIKAGTYTLSPMTGSFYPVGSNVTDLGVLIQVNGYAEAVATAQQFLVDNASKFSIKWRGETYVNSIPSVDNSYNATSNNAQSGKAVAQALASLPSIPSGSQTIKLSNNAYSVNYGSTLTSPTQTVSGSFDAPSATLDTTSTTYSYSYAYGCGTPLTQDFADVAKSGGSIAISFSESSSSMFTFGPNAPYGALIDGMRPGCWFIYNGSDPTKCILLPGSAVGCVNMFGAYFYVNITSSRVITLDFSNVVCFNGATLSDVTAGTWYLGFCSKTSTNSCPTTTQNNWGAIFANSTSTVPANTYSGSIPSPLDVSNPLPTSSVGDAGKVLKVDANGAPEWGVGGAQADWTETDNTDPSYIQNKPTVLGMVAGSGISITESASAITISADSQLPSYSTTTDVGKVLQVTANGLAWVSLS